MLLSRLFKKDKNKMKNTHVKKKSREDTEEIAKRKGELGEYKIDLQLSQFPNDFKFISDLLIVNSKAKSGYSQVDHVVICPYGIFVIETKNYQGTIYGSVNRKEWLVNGKFKFMNPFIQNFGHIQALKSFVDPKFHESFISIVSFTKRCTFKTDLSLRNIQSSELIVYDVELTEFINRKIAVLRLLNSSPLFSDEDIKICFSEIKKANILNEAIRTQHIENLKTPLLLDKCTICGKDVTIKVANFCMNNKKFNGKVYCFDHQKNL